MRSSAPALLLALALLPGAGQAGGGPSARVVADRGLAGPTELPLFLPTDLAVAPDGSVWVADGVNDRLVHLGATGGALGELRAVGSEALARPMGLDVDASGRLWIADSGHGRVLVRAPDGSLERVIVPPTGGHADWTDVAAAQDGSSAWIVDNDGQRLWRWGGAEATLEPYGRRGEALDQVDHPFQATVGPEGEVYVTDVLNGRVQVVTSALKPRPSVGRYGVDLGELYRPKGVARDDRGDLWVSDADLGVVQVYTATGAFVDVLRNSTGEILRLERPMGLDWRDGRLYVLESLAGRVRVLDVDVHAGRRLGTQPHRDVQGKPKDCTACHMELMPMLAQGLPTPLAAVPPSTPEQPPASREQACLSCHDGSVEDSRRTVWVEHGHGADVVPPEGMEIPGDIPLVGGHLACRSCHSAHTEGGAGRTCREAIFLRVGADPNELCIACHGDMNERRAPVPEPGEGDTSDEKPSGHLR